MSVPTIWAIDSGKKIIIVSPKKVPLPTEVRPTMKPPIEPDGDRANPVGGLEAERRTALSGVHHRLDEERQPADEQRDPENLLGGVLPAVTVRVLEDRATPTPASDIGADPSSIQRVSDRLTVPSCR